METAQETLAISSHQRTELLHKLSLHIIHSQVLQNCLKDRDKPLTVDLVSAFTLSLSDVMNAGINNY